ncbi:MAG: three-Cys-motif partner protein TcmP [Chloroflexi bacterium]|nr:three-Cys-motif partner protein TcmP [Chloroflexota bacterium]
MGLKLDRIGYWSEIKLDILRQYAQAYSTILTNTNLYHVYIDAFAGAGRHISRRTGDLIPGSPIIALEIVPPFKEYFFIDIDSSKVSELTKNTSHRPEVHIYEGDCNEKLLKEVFPKVQYRDYRRGLCLLDPYGLHLNWQVIETAGQMKTIDMFLNFPVADMNRNVFWRNVDGVDRADIERMNAYWGDESWRTVAYSQVPSLFGGDKELKMTNKTIAQAFRKRLLEVAGFEYVPQPLAMRNSRGSVIYYLFFASQQWVADKIVKDIVKDIFKKYTR